MEMNTTRPSVSVTDVVNYMDCRRRGVLRLTNMGREAMDLSDQPVSATKVCGILAHSYAENRLANRGHGYELDYDENSVIVEHKSLMERQIRFNSRLPDTHTLVDVARKIGKAVVQWLRDFESKLHGYKAIECEAEMGLDGLRGRPDFIIKGENITYILDLKVGARKADADSVKRHVHQMAGYHFLGQQFADTVDCSILSVSTKEPEEVHLFGLKPYLKRIGFETSAEELLKQKNDILLNKNYHHLREPANVNSIYCNRSSCPFYGNGQLCPETADD